MLLSMHMFWSLVEFTASSELYDSNEHDAILRLLGAILSALSLVNNKTTQTCAFDSSYTTKNRFDSMWLTLLKPTKYKLIICSVIQLV